jgi:hypothetical protein
MVATRNARALAPGQDAAIVRLPVKPSPAHRPQCPHPARPRSGSERLHYDADVPALALRITGTGRRTFVVTAPHRHRQELPAQARRRQGDHPRRRAARRHGHHGQGRPQLCSWSGTRSAAKSGVLPAPGGRIEVLDAIGQVRVPVARTRLDRSPPRALG